MFCMMQYKFRMNADFAYPFSGRSPCDSSRQISHPIVIAVSCFHTCCFPVINCYVIASLIIFYIGNSHLRFIKCTCPQIKRPFIRLDLGRVVVINLLLYTPCPFIKSPLRIPTILYVIWRLSGDG
jgi:hypothetical protein